MTRTNNSSFPLINFVYTSTLLNNHAEHYTVNHEKFNNSSRNLLEDLLDKNITAIRTDMLIRVPRESR